MLPEGTYDIAYAACSACDPGAVPDYLAILAGRLRGVVTIDAAEEYSATLHLVEMRRDGDPGVDVLDLFRSPVVALGWNADTRMFDGRVPYGAAADFVPMFRRVGDDLVCDFDVRHAKHDVGATSCSVAPRTDR